MIVCAPFPENNGAKKIEQLQAGKCMMGKTKTGDIWHFDCIYHCDTIDRNCFAKPQCVFFGQVPPHIKRVYIYIHRCIYPHAKRPCLPCQDESKPTFLAKGFKNNINMIQIHTLYFCFSRGSLCRLCIPQLKRGSPCKQGHTLEECGFRKKLQTKQTQTDMHGNKRCSKERF